MSFSNEVNKEKSFPHSSAEKKSDIEIYLFLRPTLQTIGSDDDIKTNKWKNKQIFARFLLLVHASSFIMLKSCVIVGE